MSWEFIGWGLALAGGLSVITFLWWTARTISALVKYTDDIYRYTRERLDNLELDVSQLRAAVKKSRDEREKRALLGENPVRPGSAISEE